MEGKCRRHPCFRSLSKSKIATLLPTRLLLSRLASSRPRLLLLLPSVIQTCSKIPRHHPASPPTGDHGGLTGVSVPTSFALPASVVFINSVWFLSLVLSLTCALMATLLQQCARRYFQIGQQKHAPSTMSPPSDSDGVCDGVREAQN